MCIHVHVNVQKKIQIENVKVSSCEKSHVLGRAFLLSETGKCLVYVVVHLKVMYRSYRKCTVYIYERKKHY